MAELTQTSWVLAILAAIAVGMSKGGLTMIATMAVPLMALSMSPVVAAGIMLPIFVVSDIGGLIAFRRSFDRRVLWTLLPGAIIGIGLGWATAHLINDVAVMGLVGVIGVSFALNALFRSSGQKLRQPSPAAGNFWGSVAGYTSFVSHSGAPPYQVYAQPLGMSSQLYAGTTTVFFAIVNAVKLIPYAALGQLSMANLRVSLMLVPAAIFGVCLGLWLLRIMPQALFYKLITWALLLVSLRLIWSSGSALFG
ncbi:sulfite exporter TauE/SafE family protein [Paracoccus albus]|uniref:sulfite exporter TauE/SafE family protein n=1 Tax=Paracoccus albus TaxID=3017784 RepID=UPI0022F0B0CD|nr:sulfite exporter TauE/SafE family protein [Paracoccus albus]WBU60948.1 sulfite exporter TauE/SafE family protein [Paracoccus albus]